MPTPSLKAGWVVVEKPAENFSCYLPRTWTDIPLESADLAAMKQMGYIMYSIDPSPHPTTARYLGSFSIYKKGFNDSPPPDGVLNALEIREVNDLESSTNIVKPVEHRIMQLLVGDALRLQYQRKMTRDNGKVETVVFLQYEFLTSNSYYLFTFETYPDQIGKYIPIYDEIAGSFQFLK